MIVYVNILAPFILSDQMVKRGQENAEKLETQELEHPSPKGMDWRQKLTSKEGWQVISVKFIGEWKMAYKEVLIGFTVASIVVTFVPDSFWNSLFLEAGADDPSFLATLQHAAIAPFLAFFTFIGSLGNVPLAAVLWTKNVSFAGVMSFLGADLVAATVIYLNGKYYGWRFALGLSFLLYLCMVAAGLTVHWTFALFNALPTARPGALSEMMSFGVDTHTFWLNIAFGIVFIVLFIHGLRVK